MSFSSFLPPHHILQYPLLEEWIFDFVLLGANDISLLRQAKGGTRKGARWQLSVLYSILLPSLMTTITYLSVLLKFSHKRS